MMDFINNNYVWVLTFIGLEIVFFTISLILVKMKKLEPDFIGGPIINAVESAILIGAIAYVDAPMWFVITLVVLCIISLSSPLLLKWKYGL